MEGLELRTARKVIGMTQAQFAFDTGYSRTTVSNWERGLYPVPKVIALLVEILLLIKLKS